MDDQLLPLVEVVRALRAELADAVAAGKDQAIRFELGAIEFELNTVVTREGSGQGHLSFKVFTWGAEANLGAKLSDQRTQKVKIVLTPVIAPGEKVMIGSTKK